MKVSVDVGIMGERGVGLGVVCGSAYWVCRSPNVRGLGAESEGSKCGFGGPNAGKGAGL